MNDDRLRAVYAELVAARATGRRDGCVSPDAIQALVAREGPEPERLGALDHVMACPHCSREFELLRSVGRAGPVLESSRRPRRQLAMAATVALAITAALYWRTTRDPQPTFRGGDDAVALVAPSGEVAAGEPLQLIWRSVENATRYEVEIAGGAGGVIWSTTTTDTMALVPDSVDIGLGAARRWWVQATLPDSRTVRSVMLEFVRR